jgi:hypothetical protein
MSPVNDAQSQRRRATRTKLTPDLALRRAWRLWLLLPILPWLTFFVALWNMLAGRPPVANKALADAWYLATTVYMIIALPTALFWRAHLFRCYAHGHGVPTKAYLMGMSALWGALSLAGLIASLGCLVTRSLMPNIGPALISLVVFASLWPTGHAMLPRLGGTDDPQVHEEPR